MKIAHISDLHFARPSYNPAQFFSKRWLGTLNSLFFRGRDFLQERPHTLLPVFKQLGVTHVLISGDLSTTSFVREFNAAKRFIEALDCQVFLIPGNHDHYTKGACTRRVFYKHFPESYGRYSLKTNRLSTSSLGSGWHLVMLDTTKAAGVRYSTGYFSKELEQLLREVLSELPKDEKVLLMNHFPFFCHEAPHRQMVRAKALEHLLLEFPQVQLYLHGHTHRRSLVDLRKSGLPIVTDSGSVSHKHRGSWNFLDLKEHSCDFSVYTWEDGWQVSQKEHYNWK